MNELTCLDIAEVLGVSISTVTRQLPGCRKIAMSFQNTYEIFFQESELIFRINYVICMSMFYSNK